MRRKPFVAWMFNASEEWDSDAEAIIYQYDDPGCDADDGWGAVVITPLEPGEPKPGETWVDIRGKEYTVKGPPFVVRGQVRVPVDPGMSIPLNRLRPKPAPKTYRLASSDDSRKAGWDIPGDGFTLTVRAESREAALAKLADALEEVKDV